LRILLLILTMSFSLSANTRALSGLRAKVSRFLETTQELTFKWRPVKGAKNYQFEIAFDDSFQNIIYKSTVKKNTIRYKMDESFMGLDITLYWRVTAKSQHSGKRYRGFSSMTLNNGGKGSPLFDTFGFFYSVTRGEFLQKGSDRGALEEFQNSPLTLGLFYTKRTSYFDSYAMSAYFSAYNNVDIAGTNDTVQIPNEIGVNFYKQYKFHERWDVYYGWDYEEFSTFNLDELNALLESASTKRQRIHYLTLGIAHSFKLMQRNFLLKTSGSVIVDSSASEKNKITAKTFSGYKAMLYLSTRLFKSVSGQFLFKYHHLDDGSLVDVYRYGVGLGFAF
jgi:hypothetical protein